MVSSVDAVALGLSVSTYYDDGVEISISSDASQYLGVRFADTAAAALGDPMDTASLAYAIYSATTESEFNQAVEVAASALEQYPSVGVVYEARAGDYDVGAPLTWDGDSGSYIPVSSSATYTDGQEQTDAQQQTDG